MGVLSGFEMALWDIIGKAVGKPVHALLGGLVHERLRTYTYLYPDEPGSHAYADGRSIATPTPRRRARSTMSRKGFTAVKFDPAGPYSTFDPRQPSLERLDPERGVLQDPARGARRFLRSLVRHAWTVHDVGRACASRKGWSPIRRCGSRSRRRRKCRSKWRASRARHVDPDRDRRAADDQIRIRARACRPAPPRSCSSTSAASAACWRPRRSREWPRRITRRSRPISIAAPIVGAANIQLSACSPNFLILESIERWDGFQAELLKKPIRWEDGYVIPPTEPGLGVELDEEVARAHPYDGRRAAPRADLCADRAAGLSAISLAAPSTPWP